MLSDPKKHHYHLTIRERHLDLLGHVNHAEYLVLYEEARWAWITPSGLGLEYVQKNKIGPVILDLSIQYKSELRLFDQVEIISRAERINSKISQIQQTMSVNGRICSEIILKFGLMDLASRKLVVPSSQWEIFFGVKA